MAKETKKKTKQQLIDSLREQKKNLQNVRFQLSAEARSKTAARRTLRKSIAQTATDLASVRKDEGGNTGTNNTSRV